MSAKIAAGIVIALIVGSVVGLYASPLVLPAKVTPVTTGKAADLRLTINTLLFNHIFYTREAIVTFFRNDQNALSSAVDELNDNTKELSDAIASIYGADAGKQFGAIWQTHVDALVEYMKATAVNDASKQAAAVSKLNAYTQDLAKFLSDANPNLSYGSLVALLQGHIGFHKQEIDILSKGDFAGELGAVWDSLVDNIVQIADVLAFAIVKQFPDKFT